MLQRDEKAQREKLRRMVAVKDTRRRKRSELGAKDCRGRGRGGGRGVQRGETEGVRRVNVGYENELGPAKTIRGMLGASKGRTCFQRDEETERREIKGKGTHTPRDGPQGAVWGRNREKVKS